MSSVLKSLSITVSFEADNEPAYSSHLSVSDTTADLENIRVIQGNVNEVITNKINLLKAENKLPEPVDLEEDEEASSDEEK